jgi:hypothetical protein
MIYHHMACIHLVKKGFTIHYVMLYLKEFRYQHISYFQRETFRTDLRVRLFFFLYCILGHLPYKGTREVSGLN